MTLKEQIKYYLRHCWWLEVRDNKFHLVTPFFEIWILNWARACFEDRIVREISFGYKARWIREIISPYDTTFDTIIHWRDKRTVSFKDSICSNKTIATLIYEQ